MRGSARGERLGSGSLPTTPLTHVHFKPGEFTDPPSGDSRRQSQDPAPATTEVPLRKFNLYQRMFLRHHSERFADHAELAVKAAICMTSMAMLFIMPEGTFKQVDTWKAKGFVGRSTVLMFPFILDHTAGQTLSNSMSALFGTGLSVLTVRMMNLVMPGGAGVDTPAYTLAVIAAHGLAVLWLILWLNVGMNARIFCATSFVFHWMEYLNPEVMACGAGQVCGSNASEIVPVVVACTLAIVCTLLPVPVLAVRKARASAREATLALTRSWIDVGAHFCGNSASDYRQDRLVADMQKIRGLLQSLDRFILHAYYEFGCLRSVRSIRETLSRLQRTLSENSDRLFCTWNTCMQQTFSQTHDDLMSRLWPHVYRVLYESSRLLTHSTEVACGGRVLDGDEGPLRSASDRTKEAISTLTGHFREMKANLGANGVGIAEELLDEHHFVLQVCAFGRTVAELSDELIGAANGSRPLAVPQGPTSIFDRVILTDKSQTSFSLRSFIVIVMAFTTGFFQHSKTMVRYDPSMAIAAALMLRKSTGSASSRNFGRLRGAVVGSMFGTAVFAVAGWCSTLGHVISGVALFSWVAMSVFAHHDTSGFGDGMPSPLSSVGASAGMLSAYFATNGIMECCTSEVFTVVDIFGSSYYKILDTLGAVFLVFAVDTMMSSETASQLAAQSFSTALHSITERFADSLDPRVMETGAGSSDVVRRLQEAEFLGKQAEAEPRLWRNPWPTLLYGDALHSANHLHMTLGGMEYAFIEGGRLGAGKTDQLRRLTGLPSFAAVKKAAIEQAEHVQILLDSAMVQETGEILLALSNPQLKRNFGAEFAHAMRAFISEANRQPEIAQERAPVNSLEFDLAAQASMLLSCIFALVAEAAAMQSSVLMRAY